MEKKAKKAKKAFTLNGSGNKKLKNTDRVRFLIWNIPAVITCPYATELCKKFCYARKAERVYPTVFPSRQRNFMFSMTADFVPSMVTEIWHYVNMRTNKGKKIVVRIHESGDFYNQAYADKWLAIAREFIGENVVFMAYTKSVRYFVDRDIPENMVIRFSIWDDTRADEIEIAKNMGLPSYSADTAEKVDEMVASGYAVKCDCADCANCGKCWDINIPRIFCVIH